MKRILKAVFILIAVLMVSGLAIGCKSKDDVEKEKENDR